LYFSIPFLLFFIAKALFLFLNGVFAVGKVINTRVCYVTGVGFAMYMALICNEYAALYVYSFSATGTRVAM